MAEKFDKWFKEEYGVAFDELQEEYEADCKQIADDCEEEGFPRWGETFDLRVTCLRESEKYQPLFEASYIFEEEVA